MIGANEFAEKVIAEATALGFECLVVCDGVVGQNYGITKILDNNSVITLMPNTLRDVYKYIMSAKRDETGMHIIAEGDGSEDSFIGLQIYDNKHQVNICTGKSKSEFMIIGIILFDPKEDEVKFYSVNTSGVADYDNPHYSTMNSKLDIINWTAGLGINGVRVYKILTDIIKGAPQEYVIRGSGNIPNNSQKVFYFNDLWDFINGHVQPGGRMTVPCIDSVLGEACTFVRKTDPSIIDFHWRNNLYEGLGTRICRFTFRDDRDCKWIRSCQITDCDINGNLKESRSPLSVCGDTPITICENKGYIDPAYDFSLYWHNVFESEKGRGIKIRKRLDDILRGWYYK